jgi:hypothetical protein
MRKELIPVEWKQREWKRKEELMAGEPKRGRKWERKKGRKMEGRKGTAMALAPLDPWKDEAQKTESRESCWGGTALK